MQLLKFFERGGIDLKEDDLYIYLYIYNIIRSLVNSFCPYRQYAASSSIRLFDAFIYLLQVLCSRRTSQQLSQVHFGRALIARWQVPLNLKWLLGLRRAGYSSLLFTHTQAPELFSLFFCI
jgi:hypothetical protein